MVSRCLRVASLRLLRSDSPPFIFSQVFIFVATRHHLLRPRSSSDSSATPSGQRGINMTVHTQTFTSPSSPRWDSSRPPLPCSSSGSSSPFGLDKKDSLDDDDDNDGIIAPGEKGRNDGGVWDGPTTAPTSFGSALRSLSPPPVRTPSRSGDKHKRRSSRIEAVARSQGHEDSRGLVMLETLGSESSFDPNRCN